MEPITLEELAGAIDGVLPTPAARRVVFERAVLDASEIRSGDLFWAVCEDSVEANEQISLAESRGVVAVVASRGVVIPGPRRILVPNARQALETFARWYRSLLDAYVIGVAGSHGKTTTRDLTSAALGIVPKDITGEPGHGDETVRLSQTLLDTAASDRFAVVRLRSDRPALANIARPEAAIMTRLDSAERQFTEEYLESLPRGGFAILPGDQPPARSAAPRPRAATLFVGRESDNTHRVSAEDVLPGRLRFRVDRFPFEIAAPGRHFSIPAGMAVIAARRLGGRDLEIAKNLESFEPSRGRGNVAVTRPWTIIDETASGQPDSFGPAMAALTEWRTSGRRFLVCGEPATNYIDLDGRAFDGIDRLVTIGNFARQIAQEARETGMDAPCLAEFSQREQATRWLRNELRPGDVVWITSARSAGLDVLVGDLVRHTESVGLVPMAA